MNTKAEQPKGTNAADIGKLVLAVLVLAAMVATPAVPLVAVPPAPPLPPLPIPNQVRPSPPLVGRNQ